MEPELILSLNSPISTLSYSWDKMASTFMTPLPASLRISFDCPYGDRLKAELQSYCGSAVEVNRSGNCIGVWVLAFLALPKITLLSLRMIY
jgi:hypothetical protein